MLLFALQCIIVHVARLIYRFEILTSMIGADLVREDDGLAMSSRNVHLSPEDRNKVLEITLCLYIAPQKTFFILHSLQNMLLASSSCMELFFWFGWRALPTYTRENPQYLFSQLIGPVIVLSCFSLLPVFYSHCTLIVQALAIYRSLSQAKSAAGNGQLNCRAVIDMVVQAINEAGGKTDYAEIVDQENLEAVEEIKSQVVFCVAAWFGKVRLIDNMRTQMQAETVLNRWQMFVETDIPQQGNLSFIRLLHKTGKFWSRLTDEQSNLVTHIMVAECSSYVLLSDCKEDVIGKLEA
ncbi:LOW QUALITY PROTEIN: Pantoate-beta-alanine ligase [Dillenia turbinata]|uniref:Pantoate-beta-alanine ligase n=1 Tax=Dillenia turbinata TaxID=194707 RepID=A0AAN8ZVQ5_9MAGN